MLGGPYVTRKSLKVDREEKERGRCDCRREAEGGHVPKPGKARKRLSLKPPNVTSPEDIAVSARGTTSDSEPQNAQRKLFIIHTACCSLRPQRLRELTSPSIPLSYEQHRLEDLRLRFFTKCPLLFLACEADATDISGCGNPPVGLRCLLEQRLGTKPMFALLTSDKWPGPGCLASAL